VIFDLWDTLALWRSDAFAQVTDRMRRHVDDFDRVWQETNDDRQTGPIDEYFRALGLSEEAVAECVRLRTEFTRKHLVAREGAVETLEELRRRGVKRGLISVCSSEVADVWGETALARHVDDVVLACKRLGVAPEECLFVGDGANDELAGAERVGMKAVCILPPGRDEPLWEEARGWEPIIESLRDVLTLV